MGLITKAKSNSKLINPTIYMSKLKREISERLYREITSQAKDLLIVLSLYQNKRGEVQGVYYIDYMCILGISKQTYYNLLKELEEKNFITIRVENKIYRTITIVGNSFENITKEDKVSYMNTNISMFQEKEYLNLSSLARRILIYCQLNIGGTGSKTNRKPFTVHINTLKERLGVVNSYHVYKAIEEINTTHYYSIKTSGTGVLVIEQYMITRNTNSELGNYVENQTRYRARLSHFVIFSDTLTEIKSLANQYAKVGANAFINFVIKSYEHFNEYNGKYVNKCCKNLLRV